MTTIIVAVTTDLAIGKNGDQLYYIKSDLRRFREFTTGHTIIMGRKTFDALPKGALPNRRNIVVSRQHGLTLPGAEVTSSLDMAIALAGDDDIFIIGGAQIFKAAMPFAERIELTEILIERPDADTFFPAIDPADWHTTAITEPMTDPSSGIAYRYRTLLRNKR
ncbi:MAG: dihydrofolate reductase [Muribaculaceae bacterium]|nr:dihydrofolate reductase [Muribaculaceae bacterium]